ncbi:hypothetical protein [Pseudomonas sp. D(2018)]|uniref:hypothetical protein n=1 Tax=Pseudomonadaceae TaxID=135621 RepID=UPI0010F9B009|nr:hypothetical protein [Pseudomonas sp. D(2018)]
MLLRACSDGAERIVSRKFLSMRFKLSPLAAALLLAAQLPATAFAASGDSTDINASASLSFGGFVSDLGFAQHQITQLYSRG